MTLEEIGKEIGFETKSKNYRKAFYDKYIRKENRNYEVIIKYYDLIHIFNLNNKVEWFWISSSVKLSEDFIREFKDKIDWEYISGCQVLSEDFMSEFQKYVNWSYISKYQLLSEDFMREFKDKISWFYISINQKLSEDFIREFQDKVMWSNISQYQVLSEDFIRVFKDNVKWYYISKYQKLSKQFIKEFKDKLYMNVQILYQYFDKEFEHSLEDLIDYKIDGEYVYGFKAVRKDRYSIYNFQYQYLDNSIHESFSDQTDNENSFGLSIGTKDYAIDYGKNNGKFILLYVRTKISDITRIVHKGEKLRTRKLEILNEVK